MSNLGTMLGYMGAAMGGYAKGKRQSQLNQQEDEERAIELDEKRMRRDRMQQEVSDDLSLRGAAEPSQITDANAGPMPEGQQARVRGQGFASMADAQAAAPALDDPAAQDSRRQQVLRAQGKGMQAMQERLTMGQANAAEQELADKVYGRGLARSLLTGGWDAFTKQLNDSPFGGAKFGMVRDPKGKKVRIQVLGEDGKDTGDGMDFSDDEDGRMKALNVAMSVSDPKSRMEFYKWTKDANQKQANWLEEMGLKKDELASTDRYRTSMAEAAGVRADKAGSGGSGSSGLERMPEAEKVKLQGIKARLGDIDGAITKSRAANEFDPASDNAKALLSERAMLIDQQDALVSRYSSGGKPSAAPIPGLDVKRSGGSRAPHTGDGAVYESPAVMEDRQAGAGLTTLHSEYGGDIRRAQADADELRAAIKAAPTPEAKAMLSTKLSAALYAVEAGKQASQQKPSAPAIKPSAPSMSSAVAGTPTNRKLMGFTVSQKADPAAYQQLDTAAKKAGYTPSLGTDGVRYYGRKVDGVMKYVTDSDMAKQLGLIWD